MTIRFSTQLRSNLVGPLGFAATFNGGVIEIYTGPQPVSADAAVSGVLLGTVTLNSLPFTPGSLTNGLTFGNPASGSLAKSGVWSFVGVAAGTAGWFRFKANAVDTGALSTTAARMDGSCAVSGADLSISNIVVAVGAPNTCDTFVFTQPSQ